MDAQVVLTIGQLINLVLTVAVCTLLALVVLLTKILMTAGRPGRMAEEVVVREGTPSLPWILIIVGMVIVMMLARQCGG